MRLLFGLTPDHGGPAQRCYALPAEAALVCDVRGLGKRSPMASDRVSCGSFDRVSVPTSRPKEAVMHAVVRSYSGQGASELFEQLEQRNEEIKDLIGGGPGFVSYTALRSSRGRRHRHRLPRQEPDRRGVSATRRVGQGGPQEH